MKIILNTILTILEILLFLFIPYYIGNIFHIDKNIIIIWLFGLSIIFISLLIFSIIKLLFEINKDIINKKGI